MNRIGRREDEDNRFGQEIEENILDMVMFFLSHSVKNGAFYKGNFNMDWNFRAARKLCKQG